MRYRVVYRRWDHPKIEVHEELDERQLRRLRGDVLRVTRASPNPREVAARAFGKARKL
jgi:DNA-directed RNA polymerase subunit H (RpoH/RPB5)